MKKGFTLIELLAVIIILAIVALIATPIVLNMIEDARISANRSSAYLLINGATNYYAESMMDDIKKIDMNGKTNIFDKIEMSGDKPSEGTVYVNKDGQVAMAVVYGNTCFKKEFVDAELIESDDIDNCILDLPEITYKCKRATTLHTEDCTQTSKGCYTAGYYVDGSQGTTTITYGNLGTDGLTSGDAFDCDVNGDGKYDSETERFYYVSDLYDTTLKSFDNNYAVLIYYNNTTLGTSDNTTTSKIMYDSSEENWHGPGTAITNLPTTTQWSNVSLSNTNRAILNETGTILTNGGTLPTLFSYSGYASRLLTAQEVNAACEIIIGSKVIGELDTCNYFLENTKYSSELMGTVGYWLETPVEFESSIAWDVNGDNRRVSNRVVNNVDFYGVRPVIEVLKTDIEY